MGEKTTVEIARALDSGRKISELTDLPQTALTVAAADMPQPDADNIILHSWEECLADRKAQSANFRHIEQQSNRMHGATIWQRYGDRAVRVNPMYPPMTTEEIDASFDLPYTRLPHPRYKGKTIPAYEMIRHSINMHRGCFGGCAFCTISAHQGKFIASRSKGSKCDQSVCARCLRPSCLHPAPCPNLNTDHGPLLEIYRAVDRLPGVKKSFIGSGVRYDLSMHPTGDKLTDATNRRYNEELIERHVSGRLKVAPEHTEPRVLEVMRKPPFEQFHAFKRIFDATNRRCGLRQQLIPYFISSHPGCTEADMAELAVKTKELDFHLEQVQDFTPTPMTVSTEIYYSGVHPYTGKPVSCARTRDEKLAQRRYFFWYDHTYRREIIDSLRRIHRPDLIEQLYPRKK